MNRRSSTFHRRCRAPSRLWRRGRPPRRRLLPRRRGGKAKRQRESVAILAHAEVAKGRGAMFCGCLLVLGVDSMKLAAPAELSFLTHPILELRHLLHSTAHL